MNQQRLAIVVAALVVLGLVAALAITSCEGERTRKRSEDAKKAEEKPAKPIEDFTIGDLRTLPTGPDRAEIGIKPQHWTSAEVAVRANHFDFQGQLDAVVCTPAEVPLSLSDGPFRITSERAAVLPKEQKRQFEFNLFAPFVDKYEPRLRGRWEMHGGGVRLINSPDLAVLPAHQYHLVVLAQNHHEYYFLNQLDSVRAPSQEHADPSYDPHYRVVLLADKSPVDLPSNLLQWTTIAYMVWDDRPADDLTPEQRQAMLDWLHWGGELIVSGPNTLDALRDSFLEPYLPATAGNARPFELETVSALEDRRWAPKVSALRVEKPWNGVDLRVRPDAHVLCQSDETPLLVERRVGRGRIVVSAFRLTQRELIGWPGYDAVFNALLLRRAPRAFSVADDFAGRSRIHVNWLNHSSGTRRHDDPERVSNLRFLSRDGTLEGSAVPPPPDDNLQGMNPFFGHGHVTSPEPPIGPGVAGWNDHSAVSELAQKSLRKATGIVVPESWKVAMALGAYVFVLVPCNWLIFRLLGRVEYAWFAAPVITLAFTIIVVKLASLDVGFARTQREIAVVEVQPNYSRAHVTIYDSLYSSLGTSYDLHTDDAASMIMPFPSGRARLPGDTDTTVTLSSRQGSDENDPGETILTGLVASSSTTLMVHGERVIDLGGPIEVERIDEQGNPIPLPQTDSVPPRQTMRYRLTNKTRLKLSGAGIAAQDQSAWLGSLEPGQSVEFELSRDPVDRAWAGPLDEAPPMLHQANESDPSTSASLILHTATRLENDELRLVAWCEEPLEGFHVSPRASQRSVATLVVAHLQYGSLPKPRRDDGSRANLIANFKNLDREDELPRGLVPEAVQDPAPPPPAGLVLPPSP